MTIHLEVVEQVNLPADKIFALLTDVSRQPEWIDEVESVAAPTTPLAAGTTYEHTAKYYGRSVTIQTEVLAIEPNHLLRQQSAGAMPAITTWRLEPDGSGTRIHLTFDGAPGELYDMIAAGLEGQIKRGFQAQIKNLAALIERG